MLHTFAQNFVVSKLLILRTFKAFDSFRLTIEVKSISAYGDNSAIATRRLSLSKSFREYALNGK